jgi:hypothetical protein
MDLRTLEDYLQVRIYADLGRGRPDFDKPHTASVVQKVKDIVENTPDVHVDVQMLLVAAYTHDWGYSGLFDHGKPLELEDIGQQKEKHMQLGAEKLKELLKDKFFDEYSGNRKDKAVFWVLNHDNLEMIRMTDDLELVVLMEADTLGGLDTSFINPSFSRESNERFLKNTREKRWPLFRTEHSKKVFEKYFKMRQDYYKKLV